MFTRPNGIFPLTTREYVVYTQVDIALNLQNHKLLVLQPHALSCNFAFERLGFDSCETQQRQKGKKMMQSEIIPVDIRVLSEQIYQYKKGVRRMALYTFPECYKDLAVEKLRHQNIDYIIQPVGNSRINLYFGRRECLDAIRHIVTRPLNELTPEEDFIIGTLLGYDLCDECHRYCKRKAECARRKVV